MKKLAITLSLFSTVAFANPTLPPSDFSSVDACLRNMMNASMTAGDYYSGIFYAAANDWAGSIERGYDGDTCQIKVNRTSLCRITSKTNNGTWAMINPIITDSFQQKAQQAINEGIQHYNDNKTIDNQKYFSITCTYQCSKGFNVERDCSGTFV